MKLSVSVPEDLWGRARERGAGLNPSRLIQTALESWTAKEPSAGYSLGRPEAADTHFAQARRRLASEAQQQFDSGYVAGAKTAAELDWPDIERFHACGFDMRRWIAIYRDSAFDASEGNLPGDAEPLSGVTPLCEELGVLVMPWEYELEHLELPSDTFLRGFGQALRDLWKEVHEGEDSAWSEDEGEEDATG